MATLTSALEVPAWELEPPSEARRARVRIPWDYPSPEGILWCFQRGSRIPHQWTVQDLARYLEKHRLHPHPDLFRFHRQELYITTQYQPYRGTSTLYRFGSVISFTLWDEFATDDQEMVRILAEDWKRMFGTGPSRGH